MDTDAMLRGEPDEWHVRALRPIARWVPITDETGRRRLVMQWAVPDLDTSAARDLLSTV